MSIAKQQVAKHIHAEANARNNTKFTARQLRGKQALSTIQDVFSKGPPRDYISNPVVNQKSVVERECSEFTAVMEEGFG
jgi:hypothetical protein